MTISPGTPSMMMGDAFGEAVRLIRGLESRELPMSEGQIVEIRLLVEEAASNGSTAFDAILHFDTIWRTSVFRGEMPYKEATESLVGDNIRKWVGNAEVFLSVVAWLEARGMQPPEVEGFRTRVEAGRAMLTPDDQFFEGEGLDDLTARAIDEDDRGLTVKFGAMGE